MNDVDEQLLDLEVGEQGRVDLARLQFWCGWNGLGDNWCPPDEENWEKSWPDHTPRWPLGSKVLAQSRWGKLRLAPSIISRNEAELFGISMPRFAIRMYLEGEKGEPLGFVNVRRLATFANQAPRWAKRASGHQLEKIERRTLGRGSPVKVLRKNCCIGDALLRLPGRFEKWTILTADLAGAYGEVGGEETESWRGTPYVRQIALSGGGLCAQATCFMATALLHRSARGVHGIADVTSLASPSVFDEMRLTGLQRLQLPDYFAHPDVGLSAIWQRALEGHFPAAAVAFGHAMQAYLKSEMPIILPVDSGRLAGQKHPAEESSTPRIRARNGNPAGMWFNPSEKRPRNHAVLIVGTDGGDLFAFNDPATLPFLVASTGELAEVAVYADYRNGDLQKCLFLPVTPGAVRMPLLDEAPDPAGRARLHRTGVLTLSHQAQGPGKLAGWPEGPAAGIGEWRLVQPAKLLQTEGATPAERTARALVRELLEREPALPDHHWCWLQVTDHGAWLWDAEAEPPTRPDPAAAWRVLLGVCGSSHGHWRVLHAALPAKSRPAAAPLAPAAEVPPGLEPSLITSYCITELAEALQHWPASVDACEVYAFMQPDGDRLLKDYAPPLWTARAITVAVQSFAANLFRKQKRAQDRYPVGYRKPFATVLQRLAAAQRSDRKHSSWSAARELARQVHACVQKERPLLIPAFATYLPEITSLDEKSGAAATNALLLLLHVAKILREDFRHPIRTIEIVGGSCVNGIWPARDNMEPYNRDSAFVANRRPAKAMVKLLLERLLPLAGPAHDAGVSFALELEPGPLYVLRGLEEVLQVCALLEKAQFWPLRPVLGFNLDVAHWGILKGISPATLLAEPKVCERIVHAHVADHAAGHFGDVTLLDQHPAAFFTSWLSAIATIAAMPRPDDVPPFSNFVSLEYESCCHPSMLNLAAVRHCSLVREGRVNC